MQPSNAITPSTLKMPQNAASRPWWDQLSKRQLQQQPLVVHPAAPTLTHFNPPIPSLTPVTNMNMFQPTLQPIRQLSGCGCGKR